MKKIILLLFISIFTAACFSSNPAKDFQEDADLIRLEHLEYWAGLLDEYHNVKGHYPFQDTLKKKAIVLVKIATKQQIQQLSKAKFDANPKGRFEERPVKALVKELEVVLERSIDEKYDLQKIPTTSPIGYSYFVTQDGYLVSVTCISCGVTKVSTLLMDGFTPTVNIVSKGMLGKVTKALTKQQMLEHPTYQKWKAKSFHKEAYARKLVTQNHNDSK